MSAADPIPAARLRVGPYTASQQRVISGALELFADHGVAGTSLQMIADGIGVTKAAVYYQFRTKEELVLAAAESELVWLQGALDAAEAQATPSLARDTLLAEVIDVAIRRRRMVRALQNDPVIVRLLAEHEPFRHLLSRLYRVLVGDDDAADARVPAVMLSGAIGTAVTHPLLSDLDDDVLHAHLLRFARRLLGLPASDEIT